MWYKVLSARYGDEWGSIHEDGGGGLVWWNNIISIRHGVGVGVGRWIDDNLRCRLYFGKIFG